MRRMNWRPSIQNVSKVASAAFAGVLFVSCTSVAPEQGSTPIAQPTSRTIQNSAVPDCGYSAYYDTKDTKGKIEIIFSLLTAEGNDTRNCGFNYIKTQVDRAEIGGAELVERSESDKFQRNTYFYTAPTGFDMQTDVITIQMGDKRYASDPATFQKINTSFYVKLKRTN